LKYWCTAELGRENARRTILYQSPYPFDLTTDHADERLHPCHP
jgi:hypothetical protein